jgi:anthranilate phosphoribosyltransferase
MNELLETIRSGAELDGIGVAALCAILLDESESVEARAGLLAALSAKGETPAEIAWFVRTLLSHARPIEIRPTGAPVMDVCGTGGDRHGLFNISTATMFVAAACGVRVVKHGNRGVTSKCGGADVLEALGIRIDLEPAQASAMLDDVGCVFLFAQKFHPAFKAVAPVRKLLAGQGVTTIFNKLGPLLNPAAPSFQLAGVFDPAMVPVYGKVFAELGRKRAWAVHGRIESGDVQGGLDEMSTLGTTDVCAVEGERLESLTLDSADYGIPRPALADLAGGDAAHNAALLEALLRNRLSGPIRDMVEWNTAGALVVAGIAPDPAAGLAAAREALRAGEAAARLDAMRAASAALPE